MPSFASALESTLHKALEAASSRRHEYATLEHLLLALIDDEHASKVMSACGVDLGEIKNTVAHYLDTELEALKVEAATKGSVVTYEAEIEKNGKKSEVVVDARGNAIDRG